MQRVIIPKGLINPNETTIVEIPANYKNVGTVVAKFKGVNLSQIDSMPHIQYPSSSSASSPSSPEQTPPQMRKRRYVRKTYPPARPIDLNYSDKYFTIGGRPTDFSEDESSHGFHPHQPKSPPPSPDVSYRGFRAGAQAQSTLQDIDDYEGSLYRDFRPKHTGTPHRRAHSPGHTPPSMEKYSSGAGAKVTRKTSVTRTSPGEVTTEETYEESWTPEYEDTPITPASLTHSSCGSPACPSGGSSSGGGYMNFTDPAAQISGAYHNFGGSSLSPGGGGGPMTQGDLMNSLGEIEANEMQRIMGDLSSYQQARRRLVFDASSLASAADVSGQILNTSSR